jgi:hypothetical protein
MYVVRRVYISPRFRCVSSRDRALGKMTGRLISLRLLSLPRIHGAQLSADVRYRYESIAWEILVTSFHHHSRKKKAVNKKATYIARPPPPPPPPPSLSLSVSFSFFLFSSLAVLLSFAEIYERIRYIAGYYSPAAIKEI